MRKCQLIINSVNANIIISTKERAWIEHLRHSLFLKRYIPAYKILNYKTATHCQLNLKRGTPSFSINFPHATYINKAYNDKDIVSIAELLLERARQEANNYCLHSSGVIIDGKGVIFWGGATGMGKTRLALRLARKFHAQIYSDEKTVVNLRDRVMLGGVRVAYLSKSYFKKHHRGQSFYYFSTDSNYCPVPIAFMIYPYVEDSSKIYYEKWGQTKFNWHLYEELSRKIRATSRRLFNNTLPVLSLDSLKLAQTRNKEIKYFTQKTPCYYMRGNEDLLCRKIIQMIRS